MLGSGDSLLSDDEGLPNVMEKMSEDDEDVEVVATVNSVGSSRPFCESGSANVSTTSGMGRLSNTPSHDVKPISKSARSGITLILAYSG